MIRVWSRFQAIQPADRQLILEAVVSLIVAWLAVRILPFATLTRLMRRFRNRDDPSTDRTKVDPDRIGCAVRAAARKSPVPITCLVQAVAAGVMLRKRGCAVVLRLGVRRRGPALARPLQAHAWIEYEHRVIVGGLENLAEYATLAGPRML